MKQRKRSNLEIMKSLVGLVKPLAPIMLGAITLGTIGYLCAIFITITGGEILFNGTLLMAGKTVQNIETLIRVLLVIAFARGFLHYGEQYCNHYIAFRILAIVRHTVFAKLRTLAPARLEQKDKADLLTMITSDIELLEVFYAHTISPIAIAFLVSLVMVIFLFSMNVYAGLVGLCAYVFIGVIIPIINGKKTGDNGMAFRTSFSQLNSYVLGSMYGLDETIQYGDGQNRAAGIDEHSKALTKEQKSLSQKEGASRSFTNIVIELFDGLLVIVMLMQVINGSADFHAALISVIALMSSFGPVTALSNLSNSLNQTLAAGERILDLLDEEPVCEEITDGKDITFHGARAEHVTFAYDKEEVLHDFSMNLEEGKVIGLHGPSGSGKSTFLKLMMRFFETKEGKITVSEENINQINTHSLRMNESLLSQETWLFQGTIAYNIAIGKWDATQEEIEDAAKKAGIHEFILSLKDGYETKIGELGDTVSDGEKQRIGLARVFLHDAPFVLLDEPTSNLDSLNEGIILKSLNEEKKDKTILLVSHRDSTMAIADQKIQMSQGRAS